MAFNLKENYSQPQRSINLNFPLNTQRLWTMTSQLQKVMTSLTELLFETDIVVWRGEAC